jgi:hypothetical protein
MEQNMEDSSMKLEYERAQCGLNLQAFPVAGHSWPVREVLQMRFAGLVSPGGFTSRGIKDSKCKQPT